MLPFHFGDSDAPLYGVFHEPSGGSFRSRSVLICNPIGHEYVRSHSAIRNLAVALASQGFYVLRFDYRGTGDSANTFSTLRLKGLCQDIAIAADELRAMSGNQQLIAIGLRLGGSLAYQANTSCHFKQLILWDPVLNGPDYLADLESMQNQMLRSSFYYTRPRSRMDLEPGEMLGYVYPAPFLEELMALRLKCLAVPQAGVSYVFSAQIPDTDDIPQDHNTDGVLEAVPDFGEWNSILRIESTLNAQKIQRFIERKISSNA